MADPRKAAQVVEMALNRAKKAVLTQAEREANKAKFLEDSAVKDRLYHGTTSDITEFDPDKARSKTGNINAVLGTFMSDNPAEASRYASEWGTTGGNVMPVYTSLKNPYHASYKEMDDLAMGVYRRMMKDPSYDPNRSYRGFDKEGQKRTFEMLEKHEPGALQDAYDFKKQLMDAGHDGIVWNLNGNREVIAFDPKQIKSAIGNQGTYDTTNPDITKAHGGIVHMADGGDVDAEREQAELDRMRLELSNSPVIEATPQSTTQKLLGTVGGYMDRAGKFINESLEPIAQSNPVKTFLADMLLAAPLKGAGTALQDYTKTSRDITEDQPYTRSPLTGSGETLRLDPRVLDIAQFASPVIRGATKLAGEGAKALTPFAKSTAEMAAELYGTGKMPMMVAPNAYMAEPTAPKPSRVLAPANEQEFYSPTEAAALNLQRKSGNGQAFLNDIMKGENVRSDEIEAMGLDTWLKDKKNVTAAEVQDYIAQNKLRLGESRYDDSITENAMGIPEHKESKFKQYSLPGGENYREVVITMPTMPNQNAKVEQTKYGRWRVTYANGDDAIFHTEKEARDAQNGAASYRSSHWDEPNPLAHLRMSDRVTDGKKTLLVDEVQSDWHQAGREHGYRTESNVAQKAYRDYQAELKSRFENLMRDEFSEVTSDPEKIERLVQRAMNDTSVKQMSDHFDEGEKWKSLYDNYNSEWKSNKNGVPDAPYKDDWYQLALKRAVKEAIDGGYDRVALPTGKRVADRFDLTAYIDRIDYNKNPDGTYRMSAIKDDQEVFAREGVNEKDLPNIVGKEVANKLINNEGKTNHLPVDEFDPDDMAAQTYQTLSGLDLAVGGEGMKKYYDEIYPSYLKKFGKKYGANVGSTRVEIPPKSSGEVLKYDGGQAYANGQITWSEFLQRSPEAAKEFTEPLHYMEITPAMREAFKTGIHMKDGGSVNLAEGGIVAGSQGLKYADDGQVSMEAGGYVPMRRGGKVELTNDLAKMRNELQMKKGRK
jgi:hypothetical protein